MGDLNSHAHDLINWLIKFQIGGADLGVRLTLVTTPLLVILRIALEFHFAKRLPCWRPLAHGMELTRTEQENKKNKSNTDHSHVQLTWENDQKGAARELSGGHSLNKPLPQTSMII